MSPARFKSISLDAGDHQALADWWCAALGYVRREPPAGEEWPPEWPVAIHDPGGQGPLIWITPVPGRTSARGRLRLDLWGNADELLGMGARLVRRRDAERDWDVLADPEGNELYVFTPPPGPAVRPSVR